MSGGKRGHVVGSRCESFPVSYTPVRTRERGATHPRNDPPRFPPSSSSIQTELLPAPQTAFPSLLPSSQRAPTPLQSSDPPHPPARALCASKRASPSTNDERPLPRLPRSTNAHLDLQCTPGEREVLVEQVRGGLAAARGGERVLEASWVGGGRMEAKFARRDREGLGERWAYRSFQLGGTGEI